VLLRITNMRGADLNVFDFDFDLTWAAFFMTGHEHIYGRFGGRDAKSPDGYLTLSGLKYAMRSALTAYRRDQAQKPRQISSAARSAEQYTGAKRLKADTCIHCHQVYDFRREEKQGAGTWRLDDVWEFPLPASLGIILEPDQGNLIKSVKSGSPADRAGLRIGDVLSAVNGQSTASFADVQYGLHLARNVTTLPLEFRRDRKSNLTSIELSANWRQTDIGWRASMWGLEPAPSVHGQDLSAREKRVFGLPEDGMAFRQGDFVPGPAKAAGIKAGDIIFGIDGKKLDLTMLQFNAFVRLNYKTGERITFNVLRDGKRIDLPMTLPKKDH
jgi:S1-C subfamily serine protease